MVSSSGSMVIEASQYVVGDVIAAKYRLESPLGEGGMGTVWRALNLQLEAPVAIKLIRTGLDREVLTARLKQEARAAAKLGHPAIVRVFDVGESELGDPFIVMELLTGRSLAALLATEQRLAAARAVQLLLPVADALSAAHGKGIVHRDLKPDNVFIAVEDEQVQPKLVDFGIVKLAGDKEFDQHLTQAGTVLGSPEYMSPEQARGREDLDHRTDIWSFCVVLYEAVAGVTPFAGANYNALLRSIVEDEPPSLVGYLASDDRLWEIIRQGLSKDPEQRFRSMSELGRALAGWLITQGIHEDVCGSSLESKWITRTSDPFAPRVNRASFSSLTSTPPESGIRRAGLLGVPTVGADDVVPAPEPSRWRKTSMAWIAGASLALVVGTWLWVSVKKQPAPLPRIEPPFASAKVVQVEKVVEAATPVPAASVTAAPEASASAAPANSGISVTPIDSKRVVTQALHGKPNHPAPAKAKSKSNDPSRDLLAPY